MSVVREFVGGIGLLVRGLGLIVRRPRLFVLGALPPLITSTIFTVVLVVVAGSLPELVAALTPFADSWGASLAAAARVLAGVLLIAGLILIMVVSFTALTLAIGGPLYDQISERCEAEFGPVPALSEPLRVTMVRTLRQSVGLILVSAIAALVLFAAGFVPLLGQTVVPVLSVVVGGWLLGIELVGSTFERRGRPRIADRRAAMRRQRARVFGFTVPAFLLLAIPFAGAIVFPVATAGGTLLARELLGEPTQHPGTAGRQPRPAT